MGTFRAHPILSVLSVFQSLWFLCPTRIKGTSCACWSLPLVTRHHICLVEEDKVSEVVSSGPDLWSSRKFARLQVPTCPLEHGQFKSRWKFHAVCSVLRLGEVTATSVPVVAETQGTNPSAPTHNDTQNAQLMRTMRTWVVVLVDEKSIQGNVLLTSTISDPVSSQAPTSPSISLQSLLVNLPTSDPGPHP